VWINAGPAPNCKRLNYRLEAVKKSKTNTGKNACATRLVAQAFLPVLIVERFFHSSSYPSSTTPNLGKELANAESV
jgi:hypothetical protein